MKLCNMHYNQPKQKQKNKLYDENTFLVLKKTNSGGMQYQYNVGRVCQCCPLGLGGTIQLTTPMWLKELIQYPLLNILNYRTNKNKKSQD